MSKIPAENQQDYAETSAALLLAISNEARLRILTILIEQEISVGPLCDMVGLSQSSLSQHLAKLRQARLVTTRRNSTVIYYRCESPAVNQILMTLSEFFEDKASEVPTRPKAA